MPIEKIKGLANKKLSSLVLSEIGRAKERVAELERTYPSAKREELAQRLIDAKKALATTSGAFGGLLGAVSIPFDVVLITYLQISLLVDIAVLSRVNLKSTLAHDELLDLLAYANGLSPLVRSGPKLLGEIAVALLKRGGLPRLGRAVPIIAAPVSAWLNNRAITKAGEEALRFYSREGPRQLGLAD